MKRPAWIFRLTRWASLIILVPAPRYFEELLLPAVNWLAGLTSTADWIASSNPQWFPLGERCDDLRAYYENAQQLAHTALQDIGWWL